MRLAAIDRLWDRYDHVGFGREPERSGKGDTVIRPAAEHDLPTLREIERAAGQAFRTIGMAPVADDEPPTLEVLRGYAEDGRAWVVERCGELLAYLLADIVDGDVHIEQVSVRPEHARNRHGRALLDFLADWAAERGYPALTLTCFTEVPWNGPYYQRCGFRVLADDEVGPGLRAIREHEVARGLDRWPRACMQRVLKRSPGPGRAIADS